MPPTRNVVHFPQGMANLHDFLISLISRSFTIFADSAKVREFYGTNASCFVQRAYSGIGCKLLDESHILCHCRRLARQPWLPGVCRCRNSLKERKENDLEDTTYLHRASPLLSLHDAHFRREFWPSPTPYIICDTGRSKQEIRQDGRVGYGVGLRFLWSNPRGFKSHSCQYIFAFFCYSTIFFSFMSPL